MNSAKNDDLRKLLSGGDRRSLARSEEARELVRQNPDRIAGLVSLAEEADWLVATRAIDLLEKFAHEHPEWVDPCKALFIGELSRSKVWEIRLQVARALPLFKWNNRDQKKVVAILVDYCRDPQKFVRAWALDSLSILGMEHKDIQVIVRRIIRKFELDGSKALVVRVREARKRLTR